MAPKRRRVGNSTTSSATAATPSPAKKSYLNQLPAELVDRVCDFFPHRDTLLALRSTCRELATKTSSAYLKAYWTSALWTLSRSGWRNFMIMVKKHAAISCHLTGLTLLADDATVPYQNYVVAKAWGAGSTLGGLCSQLSKLHTLNVNNFVFKGSQNYVHHFLVNLRLPALMHLNVTDMVARDFSLASVIKAHKKTLHLVTFDSVDLHGGLNSMVSWMVKEGDREDAEMYRTPWSTVFDALLEIEDKCAIQIEKPMHLGREVDLLGNIEYGYDFDDDEDETEHFWGTTIQLKPSRSDMEEFPHEAMDERRMLITIERDENWKKGLRRLQMMYEYSINDPDRDGTPPWGFESEDEAQDEA